MINCDRYHQTGRTYVHIFAALVLFVGKSPGAHAPGYLCAAASRLFWSTIRVWRCLHSLNP